MNSTTIAVADSAAPDCPRPTSAREWALTLIGCGESPKRLPLPAAELEPIIAAHAGLLAEGVGPRRASALLRHLDRPGFQIIDGDGQATPRRARLSLARIGA